MHSTHDIIDEKTIKIKNLHVMFRSFRGDMNNVWEQYCFLEEHVGNSKVKEFECLSFYSSKVYKKDLQDAGGMKTKFINGQNSKVHLIEAIGIFEKYISLLAEKVYTDYPKKMKSPGMDEKKMFELIMSTDNKEELVARIIEEKIRGIFYGNPSDIFAKDKCNFEIKDVFKNNYCKELELYKEIVGRRNVIIHNLGRVDRKYLRENSKSSLRENEKIAITSDYLRGTIGLLTGFAAITTKCVIENIYKGVCMTRLKDSIGHFDSASKKKWFETLLSK